MRRFPHLTKSVVAAVLVAGALAAPAATSPASASLPCCSVDIVADYHATSDLTSPIVGQQDDGGDCPFTDWGQVTPYVTYHHLYC